MGSTPLSSAANRAGFRTDRRGYQLACKSAGRPSRRVVKEPLRGSHPAPNHGRNHEQCHPIRTQEQSLVNQKAFLRRGAPVAAALALGAGAGAGVYAGFWSGGGTNAAPVTVTAAQPAAVTTTTSSLT